VTSEDRTKAFHYLKTIIEEGRGLTKWEEDFVESVNDQMDRMGSCSPKQLEILERIYAAKTP